MPWSKTDQGIFGLYRLTNLILGDVKTFYYFSIYRYRSKNEF